MKHIANFLVLLTVLVYTQIAFSQDISHTVSQIINPWDWHNYPSIPVKWKSYPNAWALKEILNVVDTKSKDYWIIQRDVQPSVICNQPLLIFIGGLVPTINEEGYKTLVEYLAKRNMHVFFPIYATEQPLGQGIDLMAGLIDSKKIAKKIEYQINKYIESNYKSCDQNTPTTILYGHSIGARIAMAMLNDTLTDKKQPLYSAVILDGVPPNVDPQGHTIDKNPLWSDDDQTRFDDKLPIPLTVIHYENDLVSKQFTDRAYQNIDSYFKQKFEIKSLRKVKYSTYTKDGKPYRITETKIVPADHYSPMSGPLGTSAPLERIFSMRNNIVFPMIKSLHGYIPDITWNEIDQYGSFPIITAVSWAAMADRFSCDGQETIWKGTFNINEVNKAKHQNHPLVTECDYSLKVMEWSFREVYGVNRETTYANQKVREVQWEGTFPEFHPVQEKPELSDR